MDGRSPRYRIARVLLFRLSVPQGGGDVGFDTSGHPDVYWYAGASMVNPVHGMVSTLTRSYPDGYIFNPLEWIYHLTMAGPGQD
jgi:hypothetical protein